MHNWIYDASLYFLPFSHLEDFRLNIDNVIKGRLGFFCSSTFMVRVEIGHAKSYIP